MKPRNIVAGALLTLLMESALAVPVVLDMTFDFFPEETAFGLWAAGTAPTDADVLADFFIFDGAPLSSNPSIAFDALTSSAVGLLNGFAPAFSFFGALPLTPYHFDWDLAAGDYTLIVYDFFADGIDPFFGGYSVSVDGVMVGAGSGNPFEIERLNFTVEAAVPEPGTLLLFTLGLLGFGAARRRRQ